VTETVFHPLSWSALLLAAAILPAKRSWVSRCLGAVALLLLLVFSSAAGAGALVGSLETQYPDLPVEAFPQTGAIVVLGGSIHSPTPFHRNSGLIDSSDRILLALRLYKAGRAPLIMCSGGGNPPESVAMSRLLQEWGAPPDAIVLDEQSLNTRENALFVYSALSLRNIRHILLITSAIHMPRAVAAFRKVGLEVTAAPADFRTGWGQAGGSGAWRFFDRVMWLVPDARYLYLSDIALREWIGLRIYRLRKWA
jgi:uncharacterized SAM-binding protein YcdF (DUF218 family)